MDRSLPRGWALKRERLHKPDGSFCIEAVAVFQTTRITTMGELERVLDKHYSRKGIIYCLYDQCMLVNKCLCCAFNQRARQTTYDLSLSAIKKPFR